MSLTFETILPSGGTSICPSFSVPAGYVPVAYANGALSLVSSTGATAGTVYAVSISAAQNPALDGVAVPPSATEVLFADANSQWLVVK